MNSKILILAELIIIGFLLSPLKAVGQIRIDDKFKYLYLSGENKYIKSDREIVFGELSKDALFESLEFSGNFKTAMDSSYYCVKIEMKNTGDEDKEIIILADDPRVDNFKFLMFEEGRIVNTYSKYILDPEVNLFGGNLITELPLRLKARTSYKLYFQINNRISLTKLRLPLKIMSRSYYGVQKVKESMFESIYIGTLFFMVIFTMLFCITYRKRIYYNYFLYLAGLVLFYGITHNYVAYFADKTSLYKMSWMLICFSYLFMVSGYVSFAEEFLRAEEFVEQKYLRIFIVFKKAFIVIQLIALLIVWFNLPFLWYSYITTFFINPILLLFVWFFIIKAIQKKYKPAYLFMLSYIPLFLVAFFLDPLAHSGLIGGNVNIIFYSAHIFELITLCIAINFRFRLIETEKDRLNIIMLEQKENLLHIELKAQEMERERLAKDLHDDLGGTLTAIKNLSSSHTNNSSLPILIDHAIADLRNLSRNMLPLNLSKNGLNKAVEQSISYLQISSEIDIDLITFGENGQLDKDQELQIYRIITELLNNLVKHSKSRKAVVQIISYTNYIHISIEDDGIGFNNENYSSGIGLLTIESRIEFLKSKLYVETSEKGTFITFDVNYKENKPLK